MNKLFILLMTLTIVSCKSKQKPTTDNEPLIKQDSSQQIQKIDTNIKISKRKKFDVRTLYPEIKKLIGKIESTPSGNYYKLILATDSTYKIEWGNDRIKRTSKKDYHFHIARKIHFKWENKNFIALIAGTGSDDWFYTFLPLDKSSPDFIIYNVLAHNKSNNIIASEYIGDTVMFIQNLLTKKIQYITEKEKCGSAFNHYCYDSIKITNDKLYYNWILPHYIDDNKRTYKRKVDIKI